MTSTPTSKRQERFAEEKASDQFAWDSIREDGELDTVDAQTLIHLGRKRAKRDLLAWALRVADKFWHEHRRHKHGDGVPKEFGGYAVRIRRHL